MNEHIEYSFEADVTRLLSGINQGIKALDAFSEVVELASTNFDLSNKELDKLTASLNRMKSPLGQLTKQFADFSAQVEKYSTGFNWVDQQIAQQEKSSKQFSASLKSSMTEYAAFQKKVAAQQELFAKSQRKLAKKEEEALNKAKDLINQLNNGADFETLAKENSDDEGSASEGGLIKDFTKTGVVQEFWDASSNLKDGEYTSEPVKSQFGYHIILRVSQKERPSLEDTKDDILETLTANKLKSDEKLSTTAWDEIRKEHGLNIIDSDIKTVYENTINKAK